MERPVGTKVHLEDYGPLKLRAGQSSQGQPVQLQSWAREAEEEGLGFCHRTMGSHGRCVNRGTAQLTWGGGSGQNLELTWVPPLVATPQSGTDSSRPPAIPAAQPMCYLSCGLWPPCKAEQGSQREAGETEAAPGSSEATWAPHPEACLPAAYTALSKKLPSSMPASSSKTEMRAGPTALGCRGD